MQTVFLFIQIILSVTLVALVLIQGKGKGLTRAWGSGSSFTRRGLEKFLFKFTFFVVTIFLAISILQIIVL